MSPSLVTTSTTPTAFAPAAAPHQAMEPMRDETVRTLPSADLYWATLDPGVLGAVSERRLRELVTERGTALAELLSVKLPVDVDGVHAVYALLTDRRVLACAIPRELLEALRWPRLLVLRPAELPEAIRTNSRVELASLNFLVGPYEPSPVRRARLRVGLLVCGTIVLAAMLAVAGIEGRTADSRAAERSALEAIDGVLHQVVGKRGDRDEGLAAIEAELGRLRRTRMRAEGDDADAAGALAAVLGAWPRGELAPRVRTETVSVSAGTVALGVVADDRDAAGQIGDALRSVKGWTLMQPQLSAADDKTGSVRLQLRLVKDETAAAQEERP